MAFKTPLGYLGCVSGPILLDSKSRISIVGCPGSGKSTLARELATRLGIAHVELDALHHQANWKPQDPAVFLSETRRLTPLDQGWVVCGNYNGTVGYDLRQRANTIVFLDYPKAIVMKRMLHRSWTRARNGTVLWNGNRERLFRLLHPNPAQNIVLWTWTRFGRYRRQYRSMASDGTWGHATVLHFGHPDEVEAFLSRFSGGV